MQNQHDSSTQQSATKDAMKNVVTPHSIPQFIVPPLDPEEIIKPSDGLRKSGSATSISKEDQLNSSLQHMSIHRAGTLIVEELNMLINYCFFR